MGKIITVEHLSKNIQDLKSKNQHLILLGGCFDILHAGHIEFLHAAKNLGGNVIVLLESDETIHKLKGKGRPVNTQADRATLLAHLSLVDLVIPLPPLLTDDDYSKLVKLIKPDIIAVTADDPLLTVKEAQAKSVNGRVEIVTPRITGYSTQEIISKIKEL